MTNRVSIYYDESGIRRILKGNEIAKIEQDVMMQKLGEVQAAFFQQFGFNGAFEIRKVDTQSKRSRTSFRIVASDKKTTMALKTQPGWLGKFL